MGGINLHSNLSLMDLIPFSLCIGILNSLKIQMFSQSNITQKYELNLVFTRLAY